MGNSALCPVTKAKSFQDIQSWAISALPCEVQV